MPLFETVTDLNEGAPVLRRRRYGVIEVVDGRFRCIRLRPLPKIITGIGVLLGQAWHRRLAGDRLWVYYNQPVRFSNFLVLKYAVSGRETSMASV